MPERPLSVDRAEIDLQKSHMFITTETRCHLTPDDSTACFKLQPVLSLEFLDREYLRGCVAVDAAENSRSGQSIQFPSSEA